MKKFLLLILLCNSAFYLQAQTVDFTYTTSSGLFCNPQSVTFTQTCTGGPTEFIWDFGNGQSSVQASQTVTFSTPGTYTVTLTALYANDAITTSKTIVINPTPTITLTANRNYLCQPGTVNFTATGSASITSYEWNFGDGSPIQTTSTNTISYNYPVYGSFTASVKGITAFGCSGTSSYGIQVSKFGITGNVAPTGGCIPIIATLSVTTTLPPGDVPANYSWDFGDASPIVNGAGGSITHSYNTTATITTANVVITSAQGCTNQFTFPPFSYGTPPFNTDAQTITGRDTFCGSEIVGFSGTATNANTYVWDFGDGTSSSTIVSTETHKYSTLGNMRVILTPYYNGCAGTKDTINIFIEGVIASFTYANTCGSKNVYQFTNTSLGNITHFEWMFTDNPSFKDSVNFNPSHTFPPIGSYTANLSLVDNTTGCTDIITANIYTAQPVFSRTTNSVCRDSLITYSISNTYAATSGFLYEFHVNGTFLSNGTDSVLNYHPAIHGSFPEYVVISDGMAGTCSDTLRLSGNTIVKGPVASFTVPSRVCADKMVTFTNNSFPFYPADNIVKWKWDFGDNKTDSVQNPLPHVYGTPATFTIVLTATDVNGCGHKYQQSLIADVIPQIRAYPAMDTICQLRDSAQLRAYTVDTLLWMPATGISCTTCDTVKVSPFTTTQYIAQATNISGCRSYDTCLVKVYAPINLQIFPQDTAVCPKQPVQYNLNVDGVTTWTPATYLNNAAIKNPVAVPDSSISYRVIVADSVGCYADTATANIIVHPFPTVNAGPDRILPYNTPFTLSPVYSTDVTNYIWTPGADLSCNNCPSPSGTALITTTYKIDVSTANGCKASDLITVFIACNNANLFLPTAFTPDKNGLNDNFYPITRGYRLIKKFIIYNRVGNKVFERNNFVPNTPALGWNGDIKNSGYGSSSEAFVWYIEAECDQGQIVVNKGSVVLIR